MSLVDRKRGRPEGHSVLDDVREEIIRTTINAVFLVESAAKLCNAGIANIRIRDGDVLRARALVAASEEMKDFLLGHPIERSRQYVVGRAFLTGELVHVPDVLSDPEYDADERVRQWGYRAVLAVPMVREGRVEGMFSLVRTDPAPIRIARSNWCAPSRTRP